MDKDKEPLVAVKREEYTKARTASGSTSLHNGDHVAETLEGLNLEEVQGIADICFPDNDFKKRYSRLNPGMQRMNIGNRLRAFCRVDDRHPAKFDKAAKPFVKAATDRINEEVKAKAAAKAEREKAAKAKADAKAKAAKERANKAAKAKAA
jgi:hypothetical protein